MARSRLRCACRPRPSPTSTRSTRRSCATASRSTASCSTSAPSRRSPTPTAAPARRARRATRRRCSTSRAACRRPAIASRSRSSRSRSSASSRRRARADRADAEGLETGTFDYSGSGDVTAPRAGRRPRVPARRRAGHDRLRLRGGRLRRLHRGHIALIQRGDLRLRGQGRQRQGRRGGRRDHLQRGPARPPGAVHRHARRPEGHPGRRPQLSPTPRRSTDQIAAGPVTLHITTSTEADLEAKTKNLIADSKQGNADETVVVGAHLDSVVAGPGINDNGSGSATILEIAEAMAEQKIKPRRALRFAFWGAEESGLLGSEHYVADAADGPAGPDLREPELRHGRLAQLRPVRLRRRRLRDRDRRASRLGQIEGVFNKYFARPGPAQRARRRSTAAPTTARSSRSASPPAASSPVPRASRPPSRRPSTAAPPAVAYDPCYHQACDTINNLSHEGAERDVRRRGARDADARQVQERLLRGRLAQGPARQVQGQAVHQPPTATSHVRLRSARGQPGRERVEAVLQHEQLEVAAGAVQPVPVANGREPVARAASRESWGRLVSTARRSWIETVSRSPRARTSGPRSRSR